MNHRLAPSPRLGRSVAILTLGVVALLGAVGATVSAANRGADPTTGVVTAAPSAASSQVAVGGTHVCALPGDGTVICWGSLNYFGELGDGFVSDPADPAGDSIVLQTVIADAASAQGRDCVDVTEDGFYIRCHGSASLAGVTALAAGYSHTCALLVDTTVKCWGSNAAIEGGHFSFSYSGGELGDGTTTVRPAPVTVIAGPGETTPLSGVRSLSAATGYTCAVLVDDTAKCWGNAPQATSLAPVTVMADASQPLTQVASISAGDRMACAVMLDGGVACWGSGFLGNQSSEGRSTSALPVQVTVAGDGATPLGGISSAALGHNVFNGPNGIGMGHSCALEASGGVVCWGYNDVSQLGNGFTPERDFAVPVVAAPGSQEALKGAIAIAAGGYFTCALIDDGSVKCWGLGLGGDSFAGGGAPVSLDMGAVSASAVAAGGDIVCAVLVDGSLWCASSEYSMEAVPGVIIAAVSPTPSPPPTPTPTGTPVPTRTPVPTATPLALATPTPIVTAPPTLAPPLIATDVDGLAGDWYYGARALVNIAFANGNYSVVATGPVRVSSGSCDLPPGTHMATFSGSGGSYSGEGGMWRASDCSFLGWTTMTLTLDGNRLVGVLENGDEAVFTKAVVAFRDSVPTPGQITLDPVILLQSVAIALGFVLLIPFPAALFDSTLEANYAEIKGWGRSARRRLGAIGARFRPRPASAATEEAAASLGSDGWRTLPRIAVALLLGVLLGCLLDPTFGLDVLSAATFAGVLGGVLVTILVFAVPALMAYRTNRRMTPTTDPADSPSDDPRGWDPYVRALPAALAVAVGCVLISRLTNFQPGYLYGLIIGITAAHKLSDTQSARTAAIATVVMLLVAAAAWFVLGWITGLVQVAGSPDLVLIVLQTALVTVMVAGLQGALFSLLPLRFFPGGKVIKWNPWAWGGLLVISGVGFWHVLVNPTSGYLADSSRTPLLTIVGLLVFFGLGSIVFWAYFRFRRLPAGASARS
jgi:alpha-tubulin suppressor-like RCC1 family protein